MSTDEQRKPPEVNQDYPDQRYFHSFMGMSVSTKPRHQPEPSVRVYRNAADDFVELTINVFSFGKLTALLDVSELRELALTLLDAAYDLEVNPAAALIAEGGPA